MDMRLHGVNRFIIATLTLFLWLPYVAAQDPPYTPPNPYNPTQICANAKSALSVAVGSFNSACDAYVAAAPSEGEGRIRDGFNCQQGFSQCQQFLVDPRRLTCADEKPTAKFCEELMIPSGSNSRCIYLEDISANDLSQWERNHSRDLKETTDAHLKAQGENQDRITALTDGLKKALEAEQAIQDQIAELQETLQKIQTDAPEQLQNLYNQYIESLEKMRLEEENTVTTFQAQQVELNGKRLEARAKCQELAATAFQADQQHRSALNQARQNRTSLDNLSGNLKRFQNRMQQYLDDCLGSEFYIQGQRQLDEQFKIMETRFNNSMKRITRILEHAQQNYDRNQVRLQEKTRSDMENITNQIQRLEQRIQQARAMAIQEQAQAQLSQDDDPVLADIEARLAELVPAQITQGCLDACSAYIKKENTVIDKDLFSKLQSTFNEANSACGGVQAHCRSEPGRLRDILGANLDADNFQCRIQRIYEAPGAPGKTTIQ